MKYRRELTPNIKFQPNRIFVRNYLFERTIKSCKATNIEFTMLKEKLGICPYEENYYEEEIIKIKDDIDKKIIKIKDDINKIYNESDEELDETFKELTKIKRPNKDESTTDWYEKNKFKKILTTIDNNGFNHKNKIGELRFNDINDLVNDIKNNTISEALSKQKLNALNEIKKTERKRNVLLMDKKY